ncbi:MAG: protein kinase domain-containing protein [Pyrinomonadaceae bacterium]
MDLENLVGETLDGKYRIERELGRGGMGAVYLSTHLGTERPVAVKVIVPQFMQRAEFVERFRREARAAGRLRHPNVVDVTDFGFADMKGGRVAYLVMEYLDGCTLGEILEEEKKLPLSWTLDILEQVSSAIGEAHEQGIIHRDLKPDNIWLEPNQRGGYTVKVLDFGIAKLETAAPENHDAATLKISQTGSVKETRAISQNATVADEVHSPTIPDNLSATAASEKQTMTGARNSKTFAAEAGTLIQPLAEISSENGTAILPLPKTAEPDTVGTKILTLEGKETSDAAPAPETASLTRVGAVLGTPLYMSPEQCRGEHLDARSDIYSLAIIAYQMLAGKTPFDGDFKAVMEAHKMIAPPPLEVKKVPKKVKRAIMSALAKNADERPQTAQAFTDELRAQSAGIGTLLQRALIIYSEHLPKFLGLAILLYAPVAIINFLQITFRALTINQIPYGFINTAVVTLLSLASAFFSFLCAYLLFGTITWLVTQMLAFPLRPVALRPALQATRGKWKALARTGFLTTFLTFLGLLACGIGFPILSVLFALAAPVAMMENLRGFAALKRSIKLVKRSPLTTTALIMIMFIIPITVSVLIAFAVKGTVKSFGGDETPAVVRQEIKEPTAGIKDDNPQKPNVVTKTDDGSRTNITIGNDKMVSINETDESKDMGKRIRATVQEALTQILLLPFSILIASFSSIVSALLYLKTRQIGGESMQDLLAQFEESDQPQSNWRKRVRERLIQSGKVTGKSASVERQSRS